MLTDQASPIEGTVSTTLDYFVTVEQIDALSRSSLALEVDEVLAGLQGGPTLLVARDHCGQAWLIARSSDKATGLRWLCAPHSELAIRCVRSGRARPMDLFRHSRTGTVTVLHAGADGTFVESVWLCADMDEEELDLIARQVA